MTSPSSPDGYGVLRETAMAVFDDLRGRNQQIRLTSSWLLTISFFAMGYFWGQTNGRPGYFVISLAFAASFGMFLWSIFPRKVWAMAHDLGKIYTKYRYKDEFTTTEADKDILEAVLADKGDGTNILISTYKDTEWRRRAQVGGISTMAAGFGLVIFEKITTLM